MPALANDQNFFAIFSSFFFFFFYNFETIEKLINQLPVSSFIVLFPMKI